MLTTARLRAGQLGGVLLEEGLQLGVGGRGRRAGDAGVDDEVGEVAGLALVDGGDGAVDARRAHAGDGARDVVVLGEVVAEEALELGLR
jgi:hypothetical protein